MTNSETADYLVACACGLCDKKVDTRPRRNGQTPKFVLGHHRKIVPPAVDVPCACECGELTPNRDSYGNPRKYVPGHGWRRKKPEQKRNQRFMLHFTKMELQALKDLAGERRLSAWIRDLMLEKLA